MPAFKDIVGHEQIIEHLQNAITMDKVSHAYILNGPDKSGKMMIAEAFAQTLIPVNRRRAKTSRISSMSAMRSRIRFR